MTYNQLTPDQKALFHLQGYQIHDMAKDWDFFTQEGEIDQDKYFHCKWEDEHKEFSETYDVPDMIRMARSSGKHFHFNSHHGITQGETEASFVDLSDAVSKLTEALSFDVEDVYKEITLKHNQVSKEARRQWRKNKGRTK